VAVSRQIGSHRSRVIFISILLVSILSLASGSRGRVVSDGVRTVVGVISLPVLVAFNRVEDAYNYSTGLIFDYGAARERNQTLSFELARVQQRVAASAELERENRRLRRMLAFQREHPEFTLLPAEVIQHARGVLTIDRGSFHGLRESMSVISPDGVIGIVSQAGPLTSSVATLQSAECRVDAMIAWNRVRGRVYGSGSELSALCTMHYIDLSGTVRDGDEVVASPDSVFPPGYPVGRVVGDPRRGQLSQSVSVMPAADPFRIDEVFVLLSASVDWRERAAAARNVSEPAVGLMDTQSLQERLAP
jgi:rod shape-determining protein MreC